MEVFEEKESRNVDVLGACWLLPSKDGSFGYIIKWSWNMIDLILWLLQKAKFGLRANWFYDHRMMTHSNYWILLSVDFWPSWQVILWQFFRLLMPKRQKRHNCESWYFLYDNRVLVRHRLGQQLWILTFLVRQMHESRTKLSVFSRPTADLVWLMTYLWLIGHLTGFLTCWC